MKKAYIIKRFDGGLSTDLQLGTKNSFAYSQHLDFRKKPSQLSVLPKTAEEGTGVIIDLIQNSLMILSGQILALGDTGYLYRRTTAGIWSSVAKLTDGTFGLSYRTDVDKVFATSSKTVSEYSPISNSPTIKIDKYGISASTLAGGVSTGGTLTYTTPIAISESATNTRSFTSDIEPLNKIRVQVADGGTGNWTLTLHDAANNTLATSTVANASITDNTYLDFVFTDQVRIYVKPNARTYHFHLTSTIADGTCFCTVAGDLSTADFSIFADRLIDTKNGMHPMETFLQYECIGNGNYLSAWEPLSEDPSNSEWLRHRLTFPAGLEVCGLSKWTEYLAIACEKKTDSGDPQSGMIFFWDGLSSTYNFFIPVPEGSPYSIHEYKDVLYYEAGGAWYAYGGGSPIKLRTMPNTDSEYTDTSDITITYPYMSTVRRGVHMLGYPSYTTNPDIEHGVYGYGATNKDFQDSFGYSHTISTGTILNTSGNLRVGHVKNYGDLLLMSWRDDSDYGIDKINNSSDPYTTATWESLLFDNGDPFKQKTPNYIICTFDPLPSDSTLILKSRTTRDGTWDYSSTFTSLNTPDNSAKFSFTSRFYEIQIGFDLTCGAETPTITSMTLVFNDNSEERLI